ncbi:MAG: cobyric acid synthase [Gemmatales bacterium]|nr:MAG: cobyric acid synthase [Gemmatales bacterium]
MTARALMIQGSSSSAGKSLLVAALCRIYRRRGQRVVPFKAQNMSNNSAVCRDGAEIGRAQAVQAVAAGVEPAAEMNPILLKPQADAQSQVVVLGRRWTTLEAKGYFRRRDELWPVVTVAFDRLRSQYDLIIIEGAGSPAELNLRDNDIANMAMARYAKAPVLLVGDIDRGGIFAQLLGTLDLLDADRPFVRGLIVNKFRGDPALFARGVGILEQRSRLPVVGVIPFLKNLAIPEEDAVALDDTNLLAKANPGEIDIAVLRFPRISNFDDFDPLRAEPGIRVRYVESSASLGRPHAIVLPGSKSTMADLHWLRQTGLAHAVVNADCPIVGICGGFQMLGKKLYDPDRVESSVKESDGLGLLPFTTTFYVAKQTCQVQAEIAPPPGRSWLVPLAGQPVTGYEIHMGKTAVTPPLLHIKQRNGIAVDETDGTSTPDGRIWGCYLHAVFANDLLRRTWLRTLGWTESGNPEGLHLDQRLDCLADAVEAALDMDLIEQMIEQGL